MNIQEMLCVRPQDIGHLPLYVAVSSQWTSWTYCAWDHRTLVSLVVDTNHYVVNYELCIVVTSYILWRQLLCLCIVKKAANKRAGHTWHYVSDHWPLRCCRYNMYMLQHYILKSCCVNCHFSVNWTWVESSFWDEMTVVTLSVDGEKLLNH